MSGAAGLQRQNGDVVGVADTPLSPIEHLDNNSNSSSNNNNNSSSSNSSSNNNNNKSTSSNSSSSSSSNSSSICNNNNSSTSRNSSSSRSSLSSSASRGETALRKHENSEGAHTQGQGKCARTSGSEEGEEEGRGAHVAVRDAEGRPVVPDVGPLRRLLEERHPAVTREVRLFVSSTFRDLMAERDCLVKRIFPQVRSNCSARRISFVEIDLRWGITLSESANGLVILQCLREIDRCRPFFLCMLGFRYGWAREPGVEDKLLEHSFDLASADYPWVRAYADRSITELEVLYGCLFYPELCENAALFYFKQQNNTDAPLCDRVKQLRRLVRSVSSAREYSDVDVLGDTVLEDLNIAIARVIPQATTPSLLDCKTLAHSAAAFSFRRGHYPRASYLSPLNDFLGMADDDLGGPSPGRGLVVVGREGMGKTALVANWYNERSHAIMLAKPKCLVFMHFFGASNESRSAVDLILRFMLEAKAFFNLELTPPTADTAIVKQFPAWLKLISAAGGEVVLLLDGVDQSSILENTANLSWLPTVFPVGVRAVLTTTLSQYQSVLETRGYRVITIQPLELQERQGIVDTFLQLYNKKLERALFEKLTAPVCTAVPLYLRSLLEELRVFGVMEQLPIQLQSYLSAPNLPSLFDKILERWEKDFGRPLVNHTCALVSVSRCGLSESTLMSILARSDLPLLPDVPEDGGHWTHTDLDEDDDKPHVDTKEDETVLLSRIASTSSLSSPSSLAAMPMSRSPRRGVVIESEPIHSRSSPCEMEVATPIVSPTTTTHVHLPNLDRWPCFIHAAQEALQSGYGNFRFAHAAIQRAVCYRYSLQDACVSSAYRRTIVNHYTEAEEDDSRLEEFPWQLYALSDWPALGRLITSSAYVFRKLWKEKRFDLLKYWNAVKNSSGQDLPANFTAMVCAFERQHSCPLSVGLLQGDIAAFLREVSRYEEAHRMFLRARQHVLQAVDRLPEAHASDVVSMLYDMSQLYVRNQATPPDEADPYGLAAAVLEDGLRLAQRGTDRDRALIKTGLAFLHLYKRPQPDVELSRHFFLEAIALWQALSHNIELATALNGLGTALQRQGKLEEAKKYFNECLSIRQSVCCGVDADLAQVHVSLGNLCVDMDETAEALPHFRLALCIYVEAFGEHPRTGHAVKGIARVYQKQGRVKESQELFEEGERLFQLASNAYHDALSSTLSSLASVRSLSNDRTGPSAEDTMDTTTSTS